MKAIHEAIKAFFAWWASLTGTEYKTYRMMGVNWPIITFIAFIILMAILFFKGGLFDYWGVLWNE